MLKPVIMIGCGGSGQKAIRYVRDAVQRRLRKAGWTEEIPRAWNFIGLDTLTVQEDKVEIPPLPDADFLRVSRGGVTYRAPYDRLLKLYPPTDEKYKHLIGWLPDPEQVHVPLESGAGQFRSVGRVPGIVALDSALRTRLEKAFNDSLALVNLPAVSEKLGVKTVLGESEQGPSPIVVVCASMAGGTGAGIALDVVDLVRRTNEAGKFPILVLFTPDIFDFKMSAGMAANSLGMLSETLAAYWSNETYSPFRTSVTNPGSGPHSIFIVSRHTLSGGELGDTKSVYRAVGETLSNWVIQNSVQEQVHNFIATNWSNNAKVHLGGYTFGENELQGAVSSFGAASVTVGRDRFASWARDLLSRMVLELLRSGHTRVTLSSSVNREVPESQQVGELAEKHYSHIYQARSRRDGKALGLSSAREEFASDHLVNQEKSRILAELQRPFVEIQQGNGSQWRAWIENQVRASREGIQFRAMSVDVPNWGSQVLRETCRAVSEVVANTSLLVAAEATRLAIEQAEADVEALGKEAQRLSDEWRRMYYAAFGELESHKGSLLRNSQPVVDAFEDVARAIALWWREMRFQRIGEIIISAVNEILRPAESAIRGVVGQVDSALGTETVREWPSSVESIPVIYRPSVIEFTLESFEKWPVLLEELCREAITGDGSLGQSQNPVEAARWLLIAGDGRDRSDDGALAPLLSTSGKYRWSPGTQAALECKADSGSMQKRVTSWIETPGSRFARFIDEGLNAYLSQECPITNEVRVDHTERLEQFRGCLEKALVQSKPLVELNTHLLGVIYEADLKVDKICVPFPFPEGHPAREIAQKIWAEETFPELPTDTSSVLISSFIANPVHPLVVSSFTKPVLSKLSEYNGDADKIQAGFWLWRRSRTLDAFVPMPPALRKSMIRGFAVARLCGFITVTLSEPVEIGASKDGPERFPYPLLSKVDGNDVLAGLLEAFSLCYARVDAEGLKVLEPYRRLHDLGDLGEEGFGHEHLYETLTNGSQSQLTVDTPKIKGNTQSGRVKSARKYLEANITRFEKLAAKELDGSECRGSNGRAQTDLPTLEIVEESSSCYKEVLELVDTVDAAEAKSVV